MLETPKFPEINHPGYFVGCEQPIHQCFEEFSSDVSSDLPPDVIPGKFLNSLRVILRVKMRVFLRFFRRDGIDLNQNGEHFRAPARWALWKGPCFLQTETHGSGKLLTVRPA